MQCNTQFPRVALLERKTTPLLATTLLWKEFVLQEMLRIWRKLICLWRFFFTLAKQWGSAFSSLKKAAQFMQTRPLWEQSLPQTLECVIRLTLTVLQENIVITSDIVNVVCWTSCPVRALLQPITVISPNHKQAALRIKVKWKFSVFLLM